MSVLIRPATEKDIPFILGAASAADSQATLKQKRGLTAEHLRQDIFTDKPKAYSIVAEYDGQIVASLIYSFFYLGSVGQVMWVTKVYIDPFSRKMNIGGAIRDYLFAQYPDIPGIYGAIVPNNKLARLFFSSLGARRLNDDYGFYLIENGEGRIYG